MGAGAGGTGSSCFAGTVLVLQDGRRSGPGWWSQPHKNVNVLNAANSTPKNG